MNPGSNTFLASSTIIIVASHFRTPELGTYRLTMNILKFFQIVNCTLDLTQIAPNFCEQRELEQTTNSSQLKLL